MQSITSLEARQELAKRELARRHLNRFIKYHDSKWQENWHHTLICEALEKVERGEIKRLMISVPPQNGKSEIVSRNFPAWYFGKHPEDNIIASSYGADLAVDFGRDARDIVDSPEYQKIFAGTILKEDSKAAGHWTTNKGGEYNAVGIGGATTGRGADIFIIDDPIKDLQEASSPVIQQRNFGWYRAVARTRLSPKGAIILIQCMTGDTPVLMADGVEKALRDVRVGDAIATYENGKLSTSTVKNWKNQGSDCIFTIKMSSGKLVRANERHPFLVKRNNNTEWIKLKNLKKGDKILSAILGASGGVLSAFSTNVKNQQRHQDIVHLTTTKRVGRVGTDHHLLTQYLAAPRISGTDMELASNNIKNFLSDKIINVQYVGNYQKKMSVPIGEESFALTTTMQREKFAGCFAMTAILQSRMERQKILCLEPLRTYEIILDEVIEVFESGREDVFDIQVDRTENFIANGLVSHNTRWHDSDLAGQILATEQGWTVLSLPAIAEVDETFRKKGEPLWTARYSLAWLTEQKSALGTALWSALYQQSPINEESQVFHRKFFKYRSIEDLREKNTRCFVTIDPAPGKTQNADNIGVCINWVDAENMWNLRAFGIKFNALNLIELMFKLHSDYHFECIGIEEGLYNDVLKPFLEAEQIKRNVFFTVKTLKHRQQMKELRIRGLQPRYEAGQIFHLKGYCDELETELLRFPKSAHDDVMDATAYQLQLAESPAGIRAEDQIMQNQRDRQGGQRSDSGF